MPVNSCKIQLWIWGLIIEIALIYLLSVGDLSTNILEFWFAIAGVTIIYFITVRLVMIGSYGSIRIIIFFAIVFRATMWFSYPSLSDDIYRYIWDGRVQLEGINPYLYSPNADEISTLQNELHIHINHPDIPTVYPPLAQIFFALNAFIEPSVEVIKLTLISVDSMLCILLTRLLAAYKIDIRRVIIYAWHPLPLIEVSGNGHVDILGVFLMMSALFTWKIKQPGLAMVALALSFLSKLVAILLFPILLYDTFKKNFSTTKKILFPLVFPFMIIVGFLPYIDAGNTLYAGLTTYLRHWHFNDLIHQILHFSLENFTPGSGKYSRYICALILVLTIIYQMLKNPDYLNAAFKIICIFLLLSPTLHPWYFLWVLPLLCFFPHPSWISFSCLIFVAYEVLIEYSVSGLWQEKSWVFLIQYVPFTILLLLENRQKYSRI